MKIWFQNRRYKCKRQLSDKPLDSSNGMATSPEPETAASTPLRNKMTDDSIIAPSAGGSESEEQMIYHHDLHHQQHSVLPPYSTLYHQNPAALTYGNSYHHQDMNYPVSGPPPSEPASYYALMGSNSGNVGSAGGQAFHQHSFSSSVRAW